MASRLNLHEELCEILESRSVYFQPPESVRMEYPAIRYELSKVDAEYADNMRYTQVVCYELTVIDKNPDTDIPSRILQHFQYCSFDRSYVSDNLNHYALKLFY